jgi:hypothetical protein
MKGERVLAEFILSNELLDSAMPLKYLSKITERKANHEHTR